MNPNTDYVYNSIRESLKFVETKHAGLLVVNSGLLFGIFTIYKEVNMLNNWLIIFPAIPFIISIALSLYAFYPRFKRKKSKKPDINLFFAEGVAQQTPDKLKELINNENTVENNLITWIHTTAKITAKKYRLFRRAVLGTIAGILVSVLYTLLCVICNIS